MMSKAETFDEFLLRHGYETPEIDMAELIHWQCSFVHESGLNHRRSIMRMRKVIEAYKEVGRKEERDKIGFIDLESSQAMKSYMDIIDNIDNIVIPSLMIPSKFFNNIDDDE